MQSLLSKVICSFFVLQLTLVGLAVFIIWNGEGYDALLAVFPLLAVLVLVPVLLILGIILLVKRLHGSVLAYVGLGLNLVVGLIAFVRFVVMSFVLGVR